MEKLGEKLFKVNTNELADVLDKEFGKASTYALADLNYHASNNNIHAIEHILTYYGITFEAWSDRCYLIKIPGPCTESKCKSIW